jgi:undecaprenyl phosphate-alpha-L-ara4N flippase subunit ArnE
MTWLQGIFIVMIVMLLSIGQVLSKLAAAGLDFSLAGIRSFMSPMLIAALVAYVVATGLWLLILKQIPLRIAYPYVALSFVFVPLMAHFILGEKLYLTTYVGAALIFAGVWISSLN